MSMTIDWNKAAEGLKRDVDKHGGFLTMQRDTLREWFGIGRLTVKISSELTSTLFEHGMIVIPDLYLSGNTIRVYLLETEIGKIAQAVAEPHNLPETALVDAVKLYDRAEAARNRRSVDVPWLAALYVFLQLVIGRPPEGWEDLDDDREPYQLVRDLAESLGFSADIAEAKETVRIGGAVCACRPHGLRWEGAPAGLGAALAEAALKQKDVFDRVLHEAAKHLLEGAEIPSRNVELGRLGLRYRHEARGGIGWLR
jgi:hypothetical protein